MSSRKTQTCKLEIYKSVEECFTWEPVYKQFKSGKWVKYAPVIPGLYPIAARDGGLKGFVEVIHEPGTGLIYRFKRKESKLPSTLHSGWWWSCKVPMPHNAPVWDMEADKAARDAAELEKLVNSSRRKKQW